MTLDHIDATSDDEVFALLPNALPTRDLIIGHNYLREVQKGISLNMACAASTATLNRTLLLNNVIDWPATGSAPATEGTTLTGNGTDKPFTHVTIRDNLMRRWDDVTSANDKGIQIDSWDEADIENNLVDVGTLTNGIRHPNTSAEIKTFNNLKTDGTLVQGYNYTIGRSDPELTTDVQDVYLAL